MPELHVRVVAGRNLLDNILMGSLHPQCAITVGTMTQSTKVHRNGGRAPVWGDKFVFNIKNPDELLMRVAVQDCQFIQRSVGQCYIPVMSLAHGNVVDQWLPLKINAKAGGEVNLRMQLVGLSDQLVVDSKSTDVKQATAVRETRREDCKDNQAEMECTKTTMTHSVQQVMDVRKLAIAVAKEAVTTIGAQDTDDMEVPSAFAAVCTKMVETLVNNQVEHRSTDVPNDDEAQNKGSFQEETELVEQLLTHRASQEHVLHVRVVAGRNLIGNILTDTLDPQCTITVGHTAQSTKVHRDGGRSPVWGEKFEFKIKRPSEAHVHVAVQDCKSSQCFMGQCRLPIQSLVHGVVVDDWVPLWINEQTCGDVNLRMQLVGVPEHQAVASKSAPVATKVQDNKDEQEAEEYAKLFQALSPSQSVLQKEVQLTGEMVAQTQPASPVLHVRVVAGRNLFDCSHTGTLHPQCSITVGTVTQSTKVHRKGGRSPAWGDKFQFRMKDPLRLHMRVAVKDCKLVEGDMGQFRLPLLSLTHGDVVDQWVSLTVNGKGHGEVNLRMQLIGLTEDQVVDALEAKAAAAHQEYLAALRAREHARRAQAQEAAHKHAEAIRRIQQQVQAKANYEEALRRHQQANPVAPMKQRPHMPPVSANQANTPADNNVPIYAAGDNTNGFDFFGGGVNTLFGGSADGSNLFGTIDPTSLFGGSGVDVTNLLGGVVDPSNLFGGGVDMSSLGDLGGVVDLNNLGDAVGSLFQ
ncbi:Aste57867_10239 [Aphanomyces stellatus]|uniref:Aste57867_10239 protein n=1 Tax=Aphanomyces stellatus TaxID=120398 RepID=A0A485KQI0_9STRA|nr:hypothetical protein As57867_010200 [Aphanomyces stellatus]VFT87114.1 Aste57867_10239 [Aphanomyces stellatus]